MRDNQSSDRRAWRAQFPVLVTDAHTLASVAVIRALGRAGYPVHASASTAGALGLASKYAYGKAVCPSYDHPAFLDWLRAYLGRHGIRVIVPSENFLLAVRPAFGEFGRLIPFGQNGQDVYAGLSKFDLFSRLTAARTDPAVSGHLPPLILVPDLNSLPGLPDLAQLPTPLHVKVDGCHATNGTAGHVCRVPSAGDALATLHQLAGQFKCAVVQGHVAGRGVGACLLIWNGQVLGEFMHRRLHEVPHTGGVSSLRESWWHSAIRSDALAKLKFLGCQGVAMMEYRWDEATDQFHLMEMNARFWGSLHLALYAGIDFPTLLLDAFHGRPSDAGAPCARGVRCRHTLPAELRYVWSRARDPEVGWPHKLWSVLEFCQLTLNPRVRSDLLFPGDRRLFWENVKQLLRPAASDSMSASEGWVVAGDRRRALR